MNRWRKALIELLRARDGDNCMLCLQPLSNRIDIDHILPLSANGSDDIANLQLAHPPCNQSKCGVRRHNSSPVPNLRERRKALNITQPELGELVGLRVETISRYENGQEIPRYIQIALEKILDDLDRKTAKKGE